MFAVSGGIFFWIPFFMAKLAWEVSSWDVRPRLLQAVWCQRLGMAVGEELSRSKKHKK